MFGAFQLGDGCKVKRSQSWKKIFRAKDKKDKDVARKNSSGSESSLSQSSVSSSPKVSSKNKHDDRTSGIVTHLTLILDISKTTAALLMEMRTIFWKTCTPHSSK